MPTSITIMTTISAGQGGGATRARHTWAAGPINLLRAARLLPEHQASMTNSYGNIGHAGSWVQVGEQRIDSMDLPETAVEARDLLARVQSGQYAADLAATARRVAEWTEQENARSLRQSAAEMAEMDRLHAEAEARERADGEAAHARACAEWAAAQAADAAAHAAERAVIDQRQAARTISRSMRRDWRRAGL